MNPRLLPPTELGARSPDVPSIMGGFEVYLAIWTASVRPFHYMTWERLGTFSFLLHSFLSFPSRESGYRCSEFAGTKLGTSGFMAPSSIHTYKLV